MMCRVVFPVWLVFFRRFAAGAAVFVSVLSSPAHAQQAHQTGGAILRYEPDSVLSEVLPPDSVPAGMLLSSTGIDLVSLSAEDAPVPVPVNRRRILESIDTADLVAKLDADRLLLSEIRKQVPENRQEAECYLTRLKKLAGLSDPLRLVPLANRVLDQAPTYFDWLGREFASTDEQMTEYYVGGARGFSFALENFRIAVMFTIMNRLDLTSRLISEMEPDQEWSYSE